MNATPIADRDAYEADGFIVARSLFGPEEMEAAAAEAQALLSRRDLISTRNLRCRWQPNVETGERLFETFDPVIDLSPACAGWPATSGCWICWRRSTATRRVCLRIN